MTTIAIFWLSLALLTLSGISTPVSSEMQKYLSLCRLLSSRIVLDESVMRTKIPVS